MRFGGWILGFLSEKIETSFSFENDFLIHPRSLSSEFTPEKKVGKEDDTFLLGFGNFSGATC